MRTIYLFTSVVLFLYSCNKETYETLETIEVEYFVDTVGNSRAIPTDYMVKSGTKLYWNTGEQVITSHADSPEGGLNPSWQSQDADYSRAVARRKINARTYTLRGDDVTSIHPYTNTYQKIPDRAKMEGWKARWLVFINACKAQGTKPVIICYIGERTNWYKPLSEYQAWLTVLADVLRSGEDISGYFVFGVEEIGQRSGSSTLYSDNEIAAWWNQINVMLKSLFPYSITMLHNNPGDKFWRATSPVLQVDMINVQETSIGNMETTANDAIGRGYAIHLHEWYGAIKASQSDATNISKLNQQLSVSQRTGCKCSGIFANDIDTQRPDTNKLKNVHIHQGNYFYGNTQPPDDTIIIPPAGNIIVNIANNYHLNNATPLINGATITGGRTYWFFTSTQSNFSLKKGTSNPVNYNNRTSFSAWLQRGYNYVLTVTNNGNTTAIDFSVN